MALRWCSIAGLALVGLTLASTTTRAEVLYKETVKPFELGGQIYTTGDIWRAIRRYGKTQHGSTSTTVGWALWNLGYRIDYKQLGDVCRPVDVKVQVQVVLNLPQWSFKHQAESKVRDYYSCVKDTVTVHERRHGEIARETGERLEERLWEGLRHVPCSQRNARAREIFSAVFNEGRRRQHAFDQRDYARDRYKRCANTDVLASSSLGTSSLHDRRVRGRNIRTGRSAEVVRTSGSDGDVSAREAELRKRFQDDSLEGGGPGSDELDPASDFDETDWNMRTFAQSAAGLFTLLGVVIGFGVWIAGRRKGKTDDDSIVVSDGPPAWMSQAIEATEAHPTDTPVSDADTPRGSASDGPPEARGAPQPRRANKSVGFGKRASRPRRPA